MICKTETDLHTLLDSLTDGEHIKATWMYVEHTVSVEGPVRKDDLHCSCFHTIRWNNDEIVPSLASLEVIRDEEVTVTRDDEDALHALLDSLEDGDTITAEYLDEKGPMTLTGTVRTGGAFLEVSGYYTLVLRQHNGLLHHKLHSVTVRRRIEQRWEREDDE